VETAAVEEVPTEEPAPVEVQVMDEEVLLKAVDYSWIQVTQTDGTVVHTQVLNAGEQYRIPAKPGLILRTGNAGGLEIYVDGEKAPSIGGAGEVRRKVLMNPKKLLAGNAVES
jgi:cytoskeleton protein RodZ